MDKMAERRKLLILFGSQTGQAEAIAGELHEDAVYKNYDVEVLSLKDEGKKFTIEDVKCAVFVCSTTGDGDPPENARKFIRKLNRKVSTVNLTDLRYALLGLGDTNYSAFCGGPKKLEKLLKQRGAQSFYGTAYADDGTDMEEAVEPWREGLWPALDSYFNSLDNKLNDISIKTLPVTENGIDAAPLTNGSTNLEQRLELLSVHQQATAEEREENNMQTAVESTDINGIDIDGTSSSEFGNVCITKNTDTAQETVETREMLFPKSAALADVSLTLPPLTPIYLDIKFLDKKTIDFTILPYQNGASFAVATSDIQSAKLVYARQLTTDDAVKRTLEISLELEKSLEYKPGDSIGVCCENFTNEVNWILNRLSLEEVADHAAELHVLSDTTKKNAVVPAFIPQPFTIRHVLTSCLGIRSVPKKSMLRALVEYVTDSAEKRRMQELCSRQGAKEYSELIRERNVCIIDILAAFKSCKPTFELLLQHLPRLQPRRYSLITSPLKDSKRIAFAFNVVKFDGIEGHAFARRGVCTGFLENLAQPYLKSTPNLSCTTNRMVQIFSTQSTGFNIPDNPTTPIIMIGPGTGVAPMLGFLRHLQAVGKKPCDTWLFYGCRHKARDYLYKLELQQLVNDGILSKLIVAFSRDSVNPDCRDARYVQHNLRHESSSIIELLLHMNAIFYVCGDAKNMAKDVRQCIINMLAQHTGCSEADAIETFKKIVADKRYKEEIWT